MAIRDCIAKVVLKSGVAMTDDHVIAAMATVERILGEMKDKGTLPPENAYGQLAKKIAAQIQHEASLKEFRASLSIIIQANKLNDYAQLKANGFSPYESLVRMMQNKFKTTAFSTETKIEGIRDRYYRQLVDTWTALGDSFSNFYQDPAKARLLLKEINHEDTTGLADAKDVALAKRGAEAWHKVADGMRQEFNANGGDIGHLEGYDMPHDIHSQDKVAGHGRDTPAFRAYLETLSGADKVAAVASGRTPAAFAKKSWIERISPLMDRAKMKDSLGRPMDDAHFNDFMSYAYDHIATNGLSDLEPGTFKGGTVASRHAQPRQLFFKDADSLIAYMRDYSERSFPDLIFGHVSGMARDIAIMKDWGPNADATFRVMRDTAVKDIANLDPANAEAARQKGVELDMLWSLLNGKSKPVINRKMANGFQAVSAINVAGKLGSAMFASLYGDRVSNHAMLYLNRMGSLRFYIENLKALSSAGLRDDMRRAGFLPEYMRNALGRFGDDMVSNTLFDKMGNVVMRISLMNAINEIPRGVFAMQLADTLGGMLGKHATFADAHQTDMHILNGYGMGDADWRLWKLAKLEDWGGSGKHMLTAESIANIPDEDIIKEFGGVDPNRVRTDAVERYLGAINMEAKNAVIEPSMQDRPFWLQSAQRGTALGELGRAFWQFKSFPWAQLNRMADMTMSRPTSSGKVAMAAYLIVASTLTGAMQKQTREMLSGKDPLNMNDPSFWGSAFLQGGALGIYGDFMYSVNQTRYGTGPLEVMAGPTIGTALDAFTSTLNAAVKAANGEDTHLLAKYMTLLKGMVPGGNLWYTKAAFDHLIFNQIQELLSPGYLQSMDEKARATYGQEKWWPAASPTPERAPNLEAAIQ